MLVDRPAGEPVSRLKGQKLVVEDKQVRFESDVDKLGDVLPKLLAPSEVAQKPLEGRIGVFGHGIAEEGGDVFDVGLMKRRNVGHVEGRLYPKLAQHALDRIVGGAGDVDDSLNPVQAEVLLNDEGPDERGAADQGDGVFLRHEVLFLELLLQLEVGGGEALHVHVNADGLAHHVL